MNSCYIAEKKGKPINGFTLIELLVVVSIIALLVSILLPALGRAREQARSVLCMTNMKTLALAASMYSDDYNDWALSTFDQMNSEATRLSWPLMLYPYASEPELYYCPAEKKSGTQYFPETVEPTQLADQIHEETGRKYEDFFTYGLNFSTFGWSPTNASYPASKRGKVESFGTIHTLIHFGDSMPSGVGYNWVTDASGIYLNRNAKTEYEALEMGVPTWAPIGFRHMGSANFAHVDGHASKVSETILTDPERKKLYWSPFLWNGKLQLW